MAEWVLKDNGGTFRPLWITPFWVSYNNSIFSEEYKHKNNAI